MHKNVYNLDSTLKHLKLTSIRLKSRLKCELPSNKINHLRWSTIRYSKLYWLGWTLTEPRWLVFILSKWYCRYVHSHLIVWMDGLPLTNNPCSSTAAANTGITLFVVSYSKPLCGGLAVYNTHATTGQVCGLQMDKFCWSTAWHQLLFIGENFTFYHHHRWSRDNACSSAFYSCDQIKTCHLQSIDYMPPKLILGFNSNIGCSKIVLHPYYLHRLTSIALQM